MKKKKIYVNKILKELNNNQTSCEVKSNFASLEDNSISIEEKINKLFNTDGYVFNKSVEITTSNKKYNTKVAALLNNHLITMDNDIIDISCIKDIKL